MKKEKKDKKTRIVFRREYLWILPLLLLSFLFLNSSNNQISQKKENNYLKDISFNNLLSQLSNPSVDINPALYPIKNDGVVDPFLTAKAAMAIDVNSGTTLFAKNENTQLWPASTTKLMTALVALDKFALDSVLTVNNPLKDGRTMNLVDKEKLTLENLLYGLLVHSANDAAFVIAENYPGGSDAFVMMMNKKAEDLNLGNTHFVNPAGFDDDKQYSTAQDLARLSLYAIKNPIIAKIVSTPAITVHDIDFKYFHPLTTVNKLLGVVPGVAGVKTGWTENAKENLINLTKKDDKEILTVILGSDDRFGETEILNNWVWKNFSWQNLNYQSKKGQ